MNRIILLTLFILFSLSSKAFGEPLLEAEGRYWISELDAKAKATALSVIGTDINLKNDLGITDKDFPEIRLIWQFLANNKLRLAYTEIDYASVKAITRSIVFEGKTYTVGSSVSSDVDLQYLRLGWIWQFIDISDGMLKLGTLLDLKGFLLDASLKAPSLGFSESEEFMCGLPTIGAVLEINPHKNVCAFAEISGIAAGGYGHFFDAELGVKIIPYKYLSIVAGYRILDMKLEDNSNNYADLELSGPFMGVTLRF